MPDSDAVRDVAERYRRFAETEAPGRSALYKAWAAGVSGDQAMQRMLAEIPPTRRQPPLVFAVTRLLGAPEEDYPAWAAWTQQHARAVVEACASRSLQTNEPLRCAALLPALSALAGPIALLEIGASAGLCLYPDRYSYRYADGPALDPVDGPSPVVLDSALRGPAAAGIAETLALPEVVWRAGVDLTPLDAADPADRTFLAALVWPGETGRRQRVLAALDIAAADPPRLRRGDASEPGVVAQAAASAPADATLVITTPGVLPHIPRAGRARLRTEIDTLRATTGARWVSLTPAGMADQWHPPLDPGRWSGFVLALDGIPCAAVDPLGAFVEWRAGEPGAPG
ncbi:DUF2332 domain-containing protein [Microbacterium sp. ET2]|uniref:DUF2332 domain-containing protein n=1 Tax=Microbacterium albipurpureum TaxID=3050384 RepID=UPI00259D162C|nr:DUF2332 domain-containing protein [Microbacterium sp. ET2 (Ac-2212)]WJL96168.1 DUF2332 domain-containing protein [Microbacterium sp. ET2 (Ac-2212)]